MVKAGSGKLTLTGANTYSGGTSPEPEPFSLTTPAAQPPEVVQSKSKAGP